MKKYDVIGLGELLIDFTENGYSSQGNQMLEINPGGAPCNVLSMLNHLGKRTSFIGMVGQDQFGKLLADTLQKTGIDTGHLYVNKKVHTTLAFVHTLEDGDREFAFYRNPGADMMLEKKHIDYTYIKSARALHYGTLSMTNEKVREATCYAIEIAKKEGLLLSFDPNLRPPLWDSLKEAKKQIMYGISQCNLLKISEEELEFITGRRDVIGEGKKLLKEFPNISLMNVTLGKKGSISFYHGKILIGHPFIMNDVVDSTGAGDCFGACVLNYVLDHGMDHLEEQNLTEMSEFANAAAALITTRKGALKSMPEKREVEELIYQYRKNL